MGVFSSEFMIGQAISHYKILEKLGEGGMGVVYKAQDTKLNRSVALKFLPEHVSSSEADSARFVQEAQAAAALNHPNICTIYGIEEHEGQQYIEMEYVDGVTLRKKFEKGPLPIKDAVMYAIQIGEALQEAHSKGIVHRDVKPENMMVNSKNQIKVMDFGLAKLKGSLKLTRTSSTVGTLAYMAPEQIHGGETDARSDIFSFGIVLFEMLTRRLPFRGEHDAAMMYSILNEEPQPIQEFLPEISSELVHILNRALEKDANDRYQTVHDMVIELRRTKKETTKVSRTPLSATSIPSSVSVFVTPSAAQNIPEAEKRFATKPLLFGAGAIALAITAVVLYRFFGSEQMHFNLASMKITRLTTENNPNSPTISPDGKYVAYLSTNRKLWLRHLGSGSSTLLQSSEKARFSNPKFSPDGNFLFYGMADNNSSSYNLYQIPIIGGTPRKMRSGGDPFDLSPDGKRIARAQRNRSQNRDELLIGSIDSTGDQILCTFKHPSYFLAPVKWSPDGKYIAGVYGDIPTNGVVYRTLAVVNTNDGTHKILNPFMWASVFGFAWLPSGNGFLLSAQSFNSGLSQLWTLSYPEGVAQRLTNDLTDYGAVSLSADAQNLVVTQQELVSSVWVIPELDMSRARELTQGRHSIEGQSGLVWTQDQKLIYTSVSTETEDLWIVDQLGNNRRQLTYNIIRAQSPSMSSDGKSIVFNGSRSAGYRLYRMDIDGGNVRQLGDIQGWMPRCSPKNSWMVYTYFDSSGFAVWKASLEDNTPALLARSMSSGVISPDGKLVAATYIDKDKGGAVGIAIISLDGGDVIKMFKEPSGRNPFRLCWAPDGRGLAYIATKERISNIWLQPLDGGPPKQLTQFTTDEIYNFDWSRDGKLLACSRGRVTSEIILRSTVQ